MLFGFNEAPVGEAAPPRPSGTPPTEGNLDALAGTSRGAWEPDSSHCFAQPWNPGIAELQLGILALGEAAVAKLELGDPRGKAFLGVRSYSSFFSLSMNAATDVPLSYGFEEY